MKGRVSVVEENGPNLIDVLVTDRDKHNFTVHAVPGPDYIAHFGGNFIQSFSRQRAPLVELWFTTTLTRIDELVNDVYVSDEAREDRGHGIRLSSFYVRAKTSQIPMSREEARFYRGIGHGLLCWCLRTLPQLRDIDYVILEASGGDTAQENARLVRYYETMGFKWCIDNPEYVEYADRDLSVCMIASKDALVSQCNTHARRFITPFTSSKYV